MKLSLEFEPQEMGTLISESLKEVKVEKIFSIVVTEFIRGILDNPSSVGKPPMPKAKSKKVKA